MFKTRLLSGIVLVIIAFATIFLGGDVLFATLLIISLIGVSELYKVVKIEKAPLGIVGYIGVVAYYVYQGVYKITKKVYVSGFIGGLIGSLANTVGVLGMIYILYADKYLALMEQQGASAGKLLFGVAFSSGIPEALVAALIVSAVSVSLIRKGKK